MRILTIIGYLTGKAKPQKRPEALKQNGWRQCSVLPKVLVSDLERSKKLPKLGSGIWIVLSHDCDITNASYENEPFVELIFAAVCPGSLNGNYEFGKNIRKLQIQEGSGLFEISIHNRKYVERSEFQDHFPSTETLSADNRDYIISWVARRYTRRGFADEFNRRIQKIREKISRKLTKKGSLLSGVYLLVSDEELPQEVDYVVTIVAIAAPGCDSVKANELLLSIEAELESCSGITVDDSDLRTEAEFTLADIREFKRWDFDYISVRDEGIQSLPPS